MAMHRNCNTVKGTKRTIYDNYDLWETYKDEAIDEIQERFDEVTEEDDEDYGKIYKPSDDEIWERIYDLDNMAWEDAEGLLNEFFSQNPAGYIIFGSLGLWDGVYDGGEVFNDWNDLMRRVKSLGDCDYIRIYDIKGHLYIEASHHDGTNCYEIKELTWKGREYYEGYTWKLHSQMRDVHNTIIKCNFYSRLPHFYDREVA